MMALSRIAMTFSSSPLPAGERSDGIEDDIRVRGLSTFGLADRPLTRSLRGVYHRAALRADPLAPASTSPLRGEVKRAPCSRPVRPPAPRTHRPIPPPP